MDLLSVQTPSSSTRNMHKQISYYKVDFHSDELLDTDVREVPAFKKGGNWIQ